MEFDESQILLIVEHCFILNLIKNNKLKTDWRVVPFGCFLIALHHKYIGILKDIQNYLVGVGMIYNPPQESEDRR